MTASDSEAPASAGNILSTSAGALNGPSVPYHISVQQGQQQLQQPSRPDSPSTTNVMPSYLASPPMNTDPFAQGHASSQQLYNSMNTIQHLPPDFSSVPSSEHDALNSQTSLNGFSSGPFRTGLQFTPFNARARQNTASLRDTSSSFPAASYPSQDIFVPSAVTQSQNVNSASYEPIHHPGRYEYGPSASQSLPSLLQNGQTKQAGFSAMDAYRLGLEPSPAQPFKAPPAGMMRDAQSTMQQSAGQQAFQSSHLSGISHPLSHQSGLPQQGPFGGHASAGGGGPVGSQGPSMVATTNAMQNTQQQPQEEISTIFVVGFPDDMTEREFQNMFTFSSGFEAATLKIPNRELTSYGSMGSGSNSRVGGVPHHYGGSNDPYNLVTVNQGGVVVDTRDGTTSSWPSAPMQFGDEGHIVQTMQPRGKQIIGFAKFRTRQEALDARDVLQGRRVDLEKGSVLKAEMAKKNLHTKRGPGASSGGGGNNNAVTGHGSLLNGAAAMQQTEALNNTLNGLQGLSGNVASGEIFLQREKELGALGAMGLAGLGQRRATVDERADLGPIGGLSSFGPRGARERAEEDERERERKRKEKEAQRLRQNSYAFEAFHSVPSQMVRQGANSLLTAESGLPTGHSLSTQSSMQSLTSQDGVSSFGGPWGSLRDVGASAALRKMTISSHAPHRPPSADQQDSPTHQDGAGSPPSGPASASGSTNPSAPFSPDSTSSSLPGPTTFQPFGPRPGSPGSEKLGLGAGSSLPNSSASSVSGMPQLNEEELARSLGALAVSTQSQQQGTISPQLPSPSSGTSSTTGRNPGDQNPPINTLYVGNLPATTSPGASSAKLEERLRELFQKQAGYRQLCFRHKSNGPMCFVEFDDTSFATKALNELNGDNLGGLIKGGGIRLSYSKNPLGVRTPTSGNGSSSLQHQQSQQALSLGFFGDFDSVRSSRRSDTMSSGMTSPTSSYYYTNMSSPPPRFSTTSPPSSTFGSPHSNPVMFPRVTAQGYGLPQGPSTFSPFGITPSIPDQPSADPSNDRLPNNLSPAQTNLEASRAS